MKPKDACENAIVVTFPSEDHSEARGRWAGDRYVFTPCGEGWRAAPSLAAVVGAGPAGRVQRARARSTRLRLRQAMGR